MTPHDAAQRQHDRFVALDPRHSVAVEACAGSGKTWLLSGRLLRLLLAGVAPGEILAITYTRKAAREIEARLRGLLVMLATAPDAQVVAELTQRGLAEAEANALLPRARGLYEAVLQAQPAITITTFHGWFARLLGGAPLDSGLLGRSLDEAAGGLLDEAWAQLAAACARAPQGELAQALLWLYAELGAHNTRKLLKAFVERRAEWRAWQAQCGGMDGVLAWLEATFGPDRDPLVALGEAAWHDELEDCARLLGRNASTDQGLAAALAQAVVELRGAPCGEAQFEAVRAAFLTGEDAPRQRKANAAQAKRLGAEGEARLLDLHASWCERLAELLAARRDRQAGRLNRYALLVGEALLAQLDALKQARRVMDFADLEGEVDRLLAQEGSAAWLQARLDARYRHILLDEFQDTNPLQWRILRGWLDAYPGTGAAPPGVFLVGDPKQSIYRFRRAEPKLFAAAADYFQREFGARRIGNAHTFRNAGGIVDVVNAVFAAEPVFTGFQPQTAERAGWPARVEVLPLVPVPAAASETTPAGLRRPLAEPRQEDEDRRRRQEAAQMAARIGEMVGRWRVRGRDGRERPARYSDILILTRRKTQLASYEAALRDAGIPFVSPGRGGLLDTLEARDLLAVLRFLADPADNLMLAQVLRAPAFALTDADLLAISGRGPAWWPALQALAADSGAPSLRRAVDLLRGWLDDSAHLPAHDLIDRIFAESDWFARCRSVLPPALWPGVRANLEALLELALGVDGGRYPSLTRFVDELKRLSASDEEAPDEGLIATAESESGEGADGGRVRIMTIHGAKGLEAPIVWLIDAHSTPRPGEGYGVAMAWPAGATAPTHFSLLGSLKEAARAQAPLLVAEREAAEREELNLLYVALTRAEQVLILSGIEAARGGRAATAWTRLHAALSGLQAVDGVVGALPVAASGAPSSAPARPASVLPPPLPAIGKLRAPAQEVGVGMQFGTALHAWLEARTRGLPLPAVTPEVEQAARKLFEAPALRRFFDPALYRRGGSETAFVDAEGKLGRIDRWVECEDAVWVLDYKSGTPEHAPLAEYRAQVAHYGAVLGALFAGRAVRAMLVFTDGSLLEVD